MSDWIRHFHTSELRAIIRYQRWLMLGVICSLLFIFLGAASPLYEGTLMLWQVQVLIALPAWGLTCYLRQSWWDRVLATVLCLLPGFGVVIAVVMNQQATAALRLNGLRVGLIGARLS